MTSQIRKANRRFYDDQRFPRGFQKSGDFTLIEAELLSAYGNTMNDLDAGRLLPENEEEKQFLQVAYGKQEAQTPLEKVWVKYTRLARGRRMFHTLTASVPRNDDNFAEEAV